MSEHHVKTVEELRAVVAFEQTVTAAERQLGIA